MEYSFKKMEMRLKDFEVINLWNKEPLKITFKDNITFLTGINGSGKSSLLNIIFDTLASHTGIPATSKNRFWSGRATFDNQVEYYSSIFPLPPTSEASRKKFDDEFNGDTNNFHDLNILQKIESFFVSDSNELIRNVRYNEDLEGHATKVQVLKNGHPLKAEQLATEIPNVFLFQEDRECLHNREKIGNIRNFSSFWFYKNSIDERFAYIREAFSIYESRVSKVIEDAFFKETLANGIVDTKSKVISEAFSRIKKKNDIINTLDNYLVLSNKKICRDKENKITLCLISSGEPISWNLLSRGEKTLIYLFLVCLIYKGSIFLLDEPEISLHVEWQKNLIEDLSKVAEGSQFIISTHSPSIVRQGWIANCLNIKM